MGIHKLMSLIQEKAPDSFREIHPDSLTGRTVVFDASMALYQFMIATLTLKEGYGVTSMTDKDDVPTSHLVGLFYRNIQLLEHNIRPVWVFDGKAPDLKEMELKKRKEKKIAAEEEMKEAMNEGDLVQAKKMAGRTIRITPKMSEDAKTLLRAMGVCVVEAPSEAEAQCAAIVQAGKAFATASEDMDTLTFGTTILLRGFNSSSKKEVVQINLEKVLQGFGMNKDQFIDLCILCGCDYLDNIEGIGPVKAFKYMKECGCIEDVVETIEHENAHGKRKQKYIISDFFKDKYSIVRDFFKNPDVTDPNEIDMKAGKIDEELLKKFLVEEKNFDPDRVDKGLVRLKKTRGQGTQARMDSFFKVTAIKSASAGKKPPPKGKLMGQKGRGSKK